MSDVALRAFPAQGRNSAIDFLRGVSIAIVAMSHTVGFMTWNFLPHTSNIPALRTNGYYGVCIFFVISGYLIARRLMTLSSLPPGQFLRVFYVQRIGRIAPCLALVVLLAAVLTSQDVPRFTFDAGGFYHFAACIATFRYNLCVLDGSLPDGWNALWSLSVEEVFYVFFPLLMLLTHRSKMVITAILLAYALLAPVYRATVDAGNVYTYFGNFDLMAIGILVAMHGKRIAARTAYLRSAYLRIAGLTGLAVIFFSTVATVDYVWVPSAIAILTGVYLLGATARTPSYGVLRPLRLAGILSYEMYLFHLPMLAVIVLPFFGWFSAVTQHQALISYACLAVYGIALFAISSVVARSYADPLNQMIRWRSSPDFKARNSYLPAPGQKTFQASASADQSIPSGVPVVRQAVLPNALTDGQITGAAPAALLMTNQRMAPRPSWRWFSPLSSIFTTTERAQLPQAIHRNPIAFRFSCSAREDQSRLLTAFLDIESIGRPTELLHGRRQSPSRVHDRASLFPPA